MLSVSELSAVRKVLRQSDTSVPLTNFWQRLHTEEGIGSPIGKRIHFNATDLSRLREMAIKTSGIDPVYGDLQGDRLTVATTSANEKLSTVGVFADLVQLARFPDNSIPTLNGGCCTPIGTVLSVPPELLNGQVFDKLVVIENGILMRCWASVSWPLEIRDAVFVYRGHGTNEVAVKQLVTEASASYGFYDFDPAGLLMAVRSGCGGIVVPAVWQEWTQNHEFRKSFNKRAEYRKQFRELANLKTSVKPLLRSIVNHIERFELAITQEHMLSHQIPLTVVPTGK